jgi:hypothetical protein
MAIVDGSFVVPATIVSALQLDGSPWLAQPPHVGSVSDTDDQARTCDVLWDNGVFDDDIPFATLIQITAADPASVAALAGQVVRRTVNNQSVEYTGVVVFIAKAILGLENEVDFAIVKTLGPGNFWWEALVSELVVVTGR